MFGNTKYINKYWSQKSRTFSPNFISCIFYFFLFISIIIDRASQYNTRKNKREPTCTVTIKKQTKNNNIKKKELHKCCRWAY